MHKSQNNWFFYAWMSKELNGWIWKNRYFRVTLLRISTYLYSFMEEVTLTIDICLITFLYRVLHQIPINILHFCRISKKYQLLFILTTRLIKQISSLRMHVWPWCFRFLEQLKNIKVVACLLSFPHNFKSLKLDLVWRNYDQITDKYLFIHKTV